MNLDIEETPVLEHVEETPKVNIQIFKIDDLKNCLEYIKQSCISPIIKKADFETIEKLMISYRTIIASFESLGIIQEYILKKKISNFIFLL